uniref:Uncharacterized protein n=1 Tax=Arundo donax TaxID=35708 RepID=A0A0A9HVC8_ARUDO
MCGGTERPKHYECGKLTFLKDENQCFLKCLLSELQRPAAQSMSHMRPFTPFFSLHSLQGRIVPTCSLQGT